MTSTLAERLRSAAEHLLPGRPPAQDPGALLDSLVVDLQRRPAADRLWLLLTCLSLSFPDEERLEASARVLARQTPGRAAVHLLDEALPDAMTAGAGTRLRVLDRSVLVLVDHTARFDVQTGIQRVLRAVVPRWQRDHQVVAVAHSPQMAALRTLAAEEQQRLAHWRPQREGADQESDAAYDPDQWEVVVPWRSTLVLGEVPPPEACGRLAALAQHSGNAVTAIGYDCIPVVSSGIVSAGQAARFTSYLGVLKHARTVAAISRSAAAEFAGFTAMLPTQGLRGPDVLPVVLPSDMANSLTDVSVAAAPRGAEPVVLCVGRLDPRKNQVALLHAAEQVWREGLAFRLVLVAGGGFGREGAEAVQALRRRGRSVTLREGISDEDLRACYEQARFTVFTSLHEGYGLPVAESFALGVPVLTTAYGSTREIAAEGGALLVDPRDDAALRDALRRMLTDDALIARLRAEIAVRPTRTWDDYAAQAWDVLT